MVVANHLVWSIKKKELQSLSNDQVLRVGYYHGMSTFNLYSQKNDSILFHLILFHLALVCTIDFNPRKGQT